MTNDRIAVLGVIILAGVAMYFLADSKEIVSMTIGGLLGWLKGVNDERGKISRVTEPAPQSTIRTE